MCYVDHEAVARQWPVEAACGRPEPLRDSPQLLMDEIFPRRRLSAKFVVAAILAGIADVWKT